MKPFEYSKLTNFLFVFYKFFVWKPILQDCILFQPIIRRVIQTLLDNFLQFWVRHGWVTDCEVRGLSFKSPGSILTSRTETSSLSRVVRDGWDPCSVPISGQKNSLLRWSLRLGRWTATTVQKTTQRQKQKQLFIHKVLSCWEETQDGLGEKWKS